MARLARLYAPGLPHYVQVRPIAGRRLFAEPDDYAVFVELLRDAARSNGLAIHAYALLPGRCDLIGTPADAGGVARTLQAVGRRYVQRVNRRSGAVGPLWDRRYRSTLIDPATALLPAIRHVERVPSTEALVADAADWPWSSLAHHLGRQQQAVVTDHAVYWALSDTPFARQAAWRAFMDARPERDHGTRLEAAVARGWAFGDADFLRLVAATGNRRATPERRGRRPRVGNLSPNSSGETNVTK